MTYVLSIIIRIYYQKTSFLIFRTFFQEASRRRKNFAHQMKKEKNYFQILNCRFYKKYSTGNLLPKILSFLDLKVNSLHKSKFVYNFSVVGGAFVTQLTLDQRHLSFLDQITTRPSLARIFKRHSFHGGTEECFDRKHGHHVNVTDFQTDFKIFLTEPKIGHYSSKFGY